MRSQKRNLQLFFISFSLLSSSLHAAQLIDLYHNDNANFIGTNNSDKVLRQSTDKRGTQHIHMQQMHNNIPVWGGAYIKHIGKQKTIMTGNIYTQLQTDLANTPTPEQMQKAITYIVKTNSNNQKILKAPDAKLFIYVAKDNTAHYAYLIQVFNQHHTPTYLIDAQTFATYAAWDNFKTLETVTVGGWGGNRRSGVLYYDGQADHLPTLTMSRDAALNMCYVRNDVAVLKDLTNELNDEQFYCDAPSQKYNMYWDGQIDNQWNGGYSPANDTLYAATITTNLFKDWFNLPVWTNQHGKAAKMIFWMHDPDPNAGFADEGYIVVGDSITQPYFPFTTLDIIAHEMGHAVTFQNSNLYYYSQSGGLNESFSDMTGKTAEYYAHGKIENWNIGGILSDPDEWLRYMDQPSKDCATVSPGDQCSVDTMEELKQRPYLDVHYTSGIFNRFFYLLATSENWDIKKAYQLMFHANQNYWTAYSDFCQASRGVWLAANELGDDETSVLSAFAKVGLDPQTCTSN